MSYEGTPVKAPPTSRRRMMPPTPQQSSYSSIEAMQWQTEMEVQGSSWNASERTDIAEMEQYLNESDCIKLEIEELELPLGPEDPEVNMTYILRNANRRGGRIFEIFKSKAECGGMSVRGSRWRGFRQGANEVLIASMAR